MTLSTNVDINANGFRVYVPWQAEEKGRHDFALRSSRPGPSGEDDERNKTQGNEGMRGQSPYFSSTMMSLLSAKRRTSGSSGEEITFRPA